MGTHEISWGFLNVSKRALETGDPFLQLQLANAYRDGIFTNSEGKELRITPSPQLSAKWFETAKDTLVRLGNKGHVQALDTLGNMFNNGDFGGKNKTPDHVKAAEYFAKAARKGNTPSLLNLFKLAGKIAGNPDNTENRKLIWAMAKAIGIVKIVPQYKEISTAVIIVPQRGKSPTETSRKYKDKIDKEKDFSSLVALFRLFGEVASTPPESGRSDRMLRTMATAAGIIPVPV